RATSDLDIVVTASDSTGVRERLRAASFHYIGELATGGSTWRAPGGVIVDALESSDRWLAAALAGAQQNLDIQGQPVLPLPYLVLMKLASGRAQDVADVSRMLGLASDAALD